MSSLQTVIGQKSGHDGFDLPKTGIQVLLFIMTDRGLRLTWLRPWKRLWLRDGQ